MAHRDVADLRRLLQETRLFVGLDERAFHAVRSTLQPRTFEAGALLCREGEIGDRLFLIAAGTAIVLKDVEGGDPVEITTLERGDVAGEMGLFGDRLRTATVQAGTKCDAWELAYHDVERLLDEEPAFAKGFLSTLSRHLARETSTAAALRAREEVRELPVALFAADRYRSRLFSERNTHGFALRFFTPFLTLDTVGLTDGFRVLIVSPHDPLEAALIEALSERGVELVAITGPVSDRVNLDACARVGLSLTHVPEPSPHAAAEHAVALMLTLNRRPHIAHHRVCAGSVSSEGLVGFDMHGRTVGILGMGRVGTHLASILRGFGCRLLAHTRTERQDLREALGLEYVDLHELFARADILSLHCPLTPETYHIIDAEAVEEMSPGVMLINTAHGGLVDTEALLRGLDAGHIGYAGLDVFEEDACLPVEEALLSGCDALRRLTSHRNVLVTGHQASLTDVAQQHIVDTILASLRAYQLGARGRDLPHIVPGVVR